MEALLPLPPGGLYNIRLAAPAPLYDRDRTTELLAGLTVEQHRLARPRQTGRREEILDITDVGAVEDRRREGHALGWHFRRGVRVCLLFFFSQKNEK